MIIPVLLVYIHETCPNNSSDIDITTIIIARRVQQLIFLISKVLMSNRTWPIWCRPCSSKREIIIITAHTPATAQVGVSYSSLLSLLSPAMVELDQAEYCLIELIVV